MHHTNAKRPPATTTPPVLVGVSARATARPPAADPAIEGSAVEDWRIGASHEARDAASLIHHLNHYGIN